MGKNVHETGVNRVQCTQAVYTVGEIGENVYTFSRKGKGSGVFLADLVAFAEQK